MFCHQTGHGGVNQYPPDARLFVTSWRTIEVSKMVSNGTPGSRLGPHRSQPSASVDLPVIGTRVSVSGANLHLKDTLMRTFGTTWKQARIEGVVVEKPKKNCRRVK